MNKNYITRLIAILLLISLAFVYISRTENDSAMALSRYGSRGDEVIKIQRALYKWGYKVGAVDGIYGSKTVAAVKQFQRNNGLSVDGIAGPQTLAAIGISSSSGQTANSNDINLLARLISAEARGESYKGQVAVGAVVANRVKHPSFPNSISGVIYQSGAFTCITDGQWNQPIANSAYQAAREVMGGSDPTGGAIYYYNPAKTTNRWMLSRPILITIGDHRFCS
ncbi:MAG: spore cortex-lytic enzyme [Clostridiales bacterium]|jgi:N-acetylmuramoyl-L-alanine amidase|nr:spore cortex-lytic enzyme [Clostridiales bacterium]